MHIKRKKSTSTCLSTVNKKRSPKSTPYLCFKSSEMRPFILKPDQVLVHLRSNFINLKYNLTKLLRSELLNTGAVGSGASGSRSY
jgi:hypothetical protein